MPLSDGMIRAAVFIYGDRPRRQSSGGLERAPIGTGFIVTVPSEANPAVRYGYVVTAAHVLEHQPKNEVWGFAPDGNFHEPVKDLDWRRPLPDRFDLAVAPFVPEDDPRDWASFELETHVLPDPPDAGLLLGSPIYYIGLLAPLGMPMVRSGTIGNLYATGLPLEHGGYAAHLVDCRSYDGFSGSPCFLRLSYADLTPVTQPHLPKPTDLPSGPKGLILYVVYLAGMFTAHIAGDYDDPEDGAASRYGVGVMMPSEAIRAALLSDELKADRARRDSDSDSAPPRPITSAGRSRDYSQRAFDVVQQATERHEQDT
jgi:Trypsin-like peptidase domain